MKNTLTVICFNLAINSSMGMEEDQGFILDKNIIHNTLQDDPILANLGNYSLEIIVGGLGGARLYRLQTEEKNLVVRIQNNGIFSTENLYEDAKIASESRYGPYLHLSNSEKGLMIMDEIPNDCSLSRTGNKFYKKLTNAIRTMHQGPLFSKKKNFLEWIRDAEEKLQNKAIHYPIMNDTDKTLYKQTIEEISSLMPLFEDDIKPCHHDLHPGNILHDDNQLVLIDFESASNDVFFFDLGITTYYHTYEDADISNFLRSYFEGDPSPEHNAKFICLRPLAGLFHAFWWADIAGLSTLSKHQEIPLYKKIQPLIRQGTMDLTSKYVQQSVAISICNEAIRLLKEDKFRQSIDFLRKKI